MTLQKCNKCYNLYQTRITKSNNFQLIVSFWDRIFRYITHFCTVTWFASLFFAIASVFCTQENRIVAKASGTNKKETPKNEVFCGKMRREISSKKNFMLFNCFLLSDVVWRISMEKFWGQVVTFGFSFLFFLFRGFKDFLVSLLELGILIWMGWRWGLCAPLLALDYPTYQFDSNKNCSPFCSILTIKPNPPDIWSPSKAHATHLRIHLKQL
jgi:hypothetical protein